MIDTGFQEVNPLQENTFFQLRKCKVTMLWLMVNFFYLSAKHDTRAYINIRQAATGQGDSYATSSLICYPNFKEN